MNDILVKNIKELVDKHLDDKMKETNYILSQIPFVKNLIIENNKLKKELQNKYNVILEINDKKESIDFMKDKEREPWDESTDDDESAKNEDIVAHNIKYMNRKKEEEQEEEEVEEEEEEEEEEVEEEEIEEEEEEYEEVEVEEEEDSNI